MSEKVEHRLLSKRGTLGKSELLALGVGQVIGAGVITLVGQAVGVTGRSAWLAYGIAVIIGFIMVIPYVFLSSTIIVKGGAYSVIKAMSGERLAGMYVVSYITQCLSLSLMGTSLGISSMAKVQKNFEEPTQPLNPALFKTISSKVNIPLATGERSYTRWGFRQFFEDRSLSIIQPDICNTGGFTEAKKICDMAHTYDMGVQLHVCGGPIATAAALQLEAVIPNFVIHEHHVGAIQPGCTNTCLYDYEPVNGKFKVPELPGIGQELTPEEMKRCKTSKVGE